jgi:hypothetical protein
LNINNTEYPRNRDEAIAMIRKIELSKDPVFLPKLNAFKAAAREAKNDAKAVVTDETGNPVLTKEGKKRVKGFGPLLFKFSEDESKYIYAFCLNNLEILTDQSSNKKGLSNAIANLFRIALLRADVFHPLEIALYLDQNYSEPHFVSVADANFRANLPDDIEIFDDDVKTKFPIAMSRPLRKSFSNYLVKENVAALALIKKEFAKMGVYPTRFFETIKDDIKTGRTPKTGKGNTRNRYIVGSATFENDAAKKWKAVMELFKPFQSSKKKGGSVSRNLNDSALFKAILILNGANPEWFERFGNRCEGCIEIVESVLNSGKKVKMFAQAKDVAVQIHFPKTKEVEDFLKEFKGSKTFGIAIFEKIAHLVD